ncbi:MAG: chromate transporter [Clostridia bacterium]|nr:chromate transporter [Clostridia bacterium]MDD6040322.1 chromate transporter [Clostridia bacterium]
MIFLQLFWAFFKTGLFAVGGGMATIPFLYEMSNSTGWFTHTDLANMIAVGESTPGPIGVNMATYVGFLTGMDVAGMPTAILGAVVATLGLVAPAVIIILIVSMILKTFRDNRYVNAAFYGLRPASTGLIAAAGLSVAVTNLLPAGWSLAAFNWKGLVLGVVLWVFSNKVKQTKELHPIVFILASAVVGVLFAM